MEGRNLEWKHNFKTVEKRRPDQSRFKFIRLNRFPVILCLIISILTCNSLAQEVVQFPKDCDCKCDNNVISNLIQAVLGGTALVACTVAGGPFLLAGCVGGSLAAVIPASLGLGNCAAVEPPECAAVCACDKKCDKIDFCPPCVPAYPTTFCPPCTFEMDHECLNECYHKVLKPDCLDIPCEGDKCIFDGKTEAIQLRDELYACGWCDFNRDQVQPCGGDANSPGEASLCQDMLAKTDGRCAFNMVVQDKQDPTPDPQKTPDPPACPEGCETHEVLGSRKCIKCSGLQPVEICQKCGGGAGNSQLLQDCFKIAAATGQCDACREC